MNEINKPEIKFNQPISAKPAHQHEAKPESKSVNISKDYKEAAAAPGAEAAGRAQLMINKSDNIESDIMRIINNPAILDRSEVYFKAAERAGVPYPVAATFATQEG